MPSYQQNVFKAIDVNWLPSSFFNISNIFHAFVSTFILNMLRVSNLCFMKYIQLLLDVKLTKYLMHDNKKRVWKWDHINKCINSQTS
jgi:hypothetical protein